MGKRTKKLHKITAYFTIFDPAKEGGFNVSFPDFPGCVTFGRNFEEAKSKAKEVLELWIEELQSRKRAVPRKTFRPIVDEVIVAMR